MATVLAKEEKLLMQVKRQNLNSIVKARTMRTTNGKGKNNENECHGEARMSMTNTNDSMASTSTMRTDK